MSGSVEQALPERLAAAKLDLRQCRELERLDRFACMFLHDIGHLSRRAPRGATLLSRTPLRTQWH